MLLYKLNIIQNNRERKENGVFSITTIIVLDRKKIIAVIDTIFAVVKRKPEKIRPVQAQAFFFTTAKVVYNCDDLLSI